MWRTLTPALRRDVFALAGAVTVVGASFGAIATAAGVPWWLCSALSLLVFAGSSQFMVVGVIAAGGAPVAALLSAVLINVRHLPFGLAVGHLLGTGRAAKFLGAHFLLDESVAFAMAQRDPRQARAVLWVSGAALFVMWNVGTVLGVLGGQAISDTAAFGLDAAFPAALLALVLPSLRDRRVRHAALLGAVIALAATPFVPAGVPVLLALLGLAAARTSRQREVAA